MINSVIKITCYYEKQVWKTEKLDRVHSLATSISTECIDDNVNTVVLSDTTFSQRKSEQL